MKIRTLLVVALFTSSPLVGQQPQIPFFKVEALSGWTSLGSEETLPYHAENIAAQWIAGARSSSGSYVFITRIDNTLDRPAFAATELLGFFSESSYADLEPEKFQSEVVEVGEVRGGVMQAVYNSFGTAKLGYEVGQGAGQAAVRSVFLPLTLWNDNRKEYFNWIYVADFRGATSSTTDLEAFEHLWHSISLAEAWTLIDTAGFNALRPTLARHHETAEPPATPTPEIAEVGGEAEVLVGAMLRILSGHGSEGDEKLLQSTRSAHPNTVIAGVLDRITQASTLAWQQQVWQRSLALVPSEQRPRLAALFLAESIAQGQQALAERIARDALNQVGDVSAVSCEELEILLDSLLQAPVADSWTSEPVRRFFRLSPEALCTELGENLERRRLLVPQLESVATRGRDGLWMPRSGDSRPRVTLLDGDLVGLQEISKKGKTLWKVQRISNLLELIAILR